MADKAGAAVLIAYATRHGSTQEVAEAVAAAFGARGLPAVLAPAKKIKDLTDYRLVVLGAPLYSGKWHRDAHGFLKRNRKALSTMPVAVFALGPRSPEAEGNWPRCREQMDRGLAKHSWLNPVSQELFGGVDPPRSKKERRDQRDWDAIRAWASGLPDVL